MTFKSIFVHPEENRLRMVWRIALNTLMYIVFAGVLIFIVGLVGSIIVIVREGVGDPTALMNRLMASPLMTIFSGFASFLGVFLATFISVKFIDKKSLKDYGLNLDNRWWHDFAFGLVLGALLMLVIFLIELAAGWITITGKFVAPGTNAFLPGIVLYLVFFILVGIYEEVLSRGYRLTTGAQGFANTMKHPQIGLFLAWFISSAWFGIMHAGNPNATVISSVGIFFAGMLLLGIGYVLTGRLGLSIGVHITWNFFQGNVFGFPVSGLTGMPTFISIEQGGNPLITGGAFGPEAGLIGLFAMLLGMGLTVLYVKWQYGDIKLHLPLTEPPAVPVEEAVIAEIVESDFVE